MNIDNDEMVECMIERLSDDLHERYGDDTVFTDAEEAFWDRCTVDTDSDFWATPECKQLLLKLWKEDILEFKDKCVLLGHDAVSIKKVMDQIIIDGLNFLGYTHKDYDESG